MLRSKPVEFFSVGFANTSSCIHCKTCDIKVPDQGNFVSFPPNKKLANICKDINWTTPQGGEGPKYFMT